MSGHAGSGLHYHGMAARRYVHEHSFLHINHQHDDIRFFCEACEEWLDRTNDHLHPNGLGGHVVSRWDASHD